MTKTAADNQFDPSNNPFSTAPGGGATTATPPQMQMGTPPPDPQMQNSQGNALGGDDIQPQTSSPTTSITSSLYEVGCLACGTQRTFTRISAKMRCTCGSNDLVYEPISVTADTLAGPEDLFASYPKGVTAYVEPKGGQWVWIVTQNGNALESGFASNRHDASFTADSAAKRHAAKRVTAEFPPKKKDKKDDDDDSGDDDGGDDEAAAADAIADSTQLPAGGAPPAAAPPQIAGTPPTPGAPVGAGAPAVAPAVPTAGSNAAGAPAQPGTVPEDPNATPVDPNAAQDPNADGTPADPLMQAMDNAQQQIDLTVDQANQLGHDAKEVAYDVDQLFSEWRCTNCGLEGRADIDESGQPAVAGDLFESQDPCSATQGQAPGDQDTDDQQPQQNQQQQVPQGEPADNSQIPTSQGGLPQVSTSRKSKSTKKTADFIQNEEDQVPGVSQRSTEDVQGGGGSDENAAVTQNLNKEERLTVMVESILDTNPGMNEEFARKVAQATLAKYPSIA